jgi:Calcineurin-like phosphoesterase
MSQTTQSSASYPECVEHGVWVPIPTNPPDDELRLRLKEVDPDEARTIKERGVMSFHALGCSGYYQDQEPGKRVAAAMANQIAQPRVHSGIPNAVPASFLFHLGDLAYKDEDPANVDAKNQALIYNAQFYAQYTTYSRPIFAIPGNHDGKSSKHQEKSGILHFQENFCDPHRGQSADNTTDHRKAMCQPYPYWRLETPITTVIGLYTNDINGGQFDDPMTEDNPQYRWLIKTLIEIKQRTERKALAIALHYPPYSGGANFRERGDPNLGPTQRRGRLQPLAVLLQQAYQQTNQYPDLVLSAHAHLYQRITYQHAGGRQVPYLIVGNGGHPPVENLFETCTKTELERRPAPLDLVLPPGSDLPAGDTAKVVAYNDTDFGFVRITVDINKNTLTGEFFAVFRSGAAPVEPEVADSFILDLERHTVGEV